VTKKKPLQNEVLLQNSSLFSLFLLT